MLLNEFLRNSFAAKRYLEVNWWIRVFSDFIENSPEKMPKQSYYLVKQPWGLGTILPSGEIEKITDYSGKGPAFDPKTSIFVDERWLGNIKGEHSTTLGILMANALLVATPLNNKIPFLNREISIPYIESLIAPKLTTNPEPGKPWSMDPDVIYVQENDNIALGIEVINAVMELFTIGLTKKTLLPPPGVEKKKKELLDTGNYDLNNPIQLSAYEGELLKFDAEYLKDDPSFGKFASGKILKDARKKLYLSMGAEGGFSKDGSIVGISRSLSEGLPRDPKQYVAVVNGSRSGSFSRGHETMEGGVAAKKMLAASNNYIITDDDCGSTMGLERYYFPWLVKSLRGRTVINGKSQSKIPIDADTSSYVGKRIRTRSPMYCRKPGEEICRVCAGDAMARFGTGIALPLTEISAAILNARMKAMHTNSLTVNKFSLKEIFT